MVINDLFEVIKDRQRNKSEGSYTCYLFDKGTDKILKKVGEECAETIIAAKNKDREELTNEICDLAYHLLVLMANEGVDIINVEEELKRRTLEISNLKTMKETNKNT